MYDIPSSSRKRQAPGLLMLVLSEARAFLHGHTVASRSPLLWEILEETAEQPVMVAALYRHGEEPNCGEGLPSC